MQQWLKTDALKEVLEVRAERNGAIQGAQSRTSPHRSLLFTSFRWLGTPGPLTAITRKCPSNASVRGQRFTCARRRHVSVPESNFLIRVAPSKPAKLIPFQAGANTSFSGGSEQNDSIAF